MKLFNRFSISILAILVVACDSTSNVALPPSPVAPTEPTAKVIAAVAMVASDFSSASMALVTDTGGERSFIEGYLPQTKSDYSVNAYGEYAFQIGKNEIDNVTKVSLENPSLALTQFSTKDNPGDTSANPHYMVFVSESKAFLLRYGSDKLWVVNPQATIPAEFKVGEIDLSAYDANEAPEMALAAIVDDRLYVVMQRLGDGAGNEYAVQRAGYVAVIDINTNTEIDTTPANAADLNGIPLNIMNPLGISVFDKKIYISALGQFFGPQSGGLDVIDTTATNLMASNLWMDTDAARTEGQVSDVAIVSATKGFVAFDEGVWPAKRSIYAYNPSTNVLSATKLEGFSSLDIREIEASPAGEVWVSLADAKMPEIAYLNEDGKESRPRTATTLVPTDIRFFE